MEVDGQMEAVKKASELIKIIKESRPVIHHITNYVTMNDSANIILAIGGSPIMANAAEEAAEVVAASKALVLNMGTPNQDNFRSMLIAGKTANKLGIPVIFDPVGAGASSYRRELCSRLLAEVRPDVIKGNLSEMRYLAGFEGSSCSIDSTGDCDDVSELVTGLAGQMSCIAACTGRMDVVSDGKTTFIIDNGHEMLKRITGTGCMTASLAGVFCSVTRDYMLGTIGGILTMGICGKLAFDCLKPGEGTGTFKARLMDQVYNLDAGTFLREGHVDA